jgi:hypothetical protein
MFDRPPTANYFKRLASAFVSLSRRQKVILICVIVMLMPFPTTVVSEWRLRAVDEQGKPLAGLQVKQIWKHYSLEWNGCCDNEEDRRTDDNGFVVFPRRTIWAGLLRRIVFPIWAQALTLMHGSTGIHAYVMTVGGGSPRLLICNPEQTCVPFAGRL